MLNFLVDLHAVRAGGGVRDSYREGQGEGGVTVFIHVYRLQRIQFSCFLRCAARHNTLAKKKPSKERQKERKSEGETEREK